MRQVERMGDRAIAEERDGHACCGEVDGEPAPFKGGAALAARDGKRASLSNRVKGYDHRAAVRECGDVHPSFAATQRRRVRPPFAAAPLRRSRLVELAGEVSSREACE